MCLLHVWKAIYIKVNQLRFDYYSQKYQGTSGQELMILMATFFYLNSINLSPTCRVYLEMHVQKSQLSGIHISFRMFQSMNGKLES